MTVTLQAWDDNSTKYFDKWKACLHENNCKHGPCTCHQGAYRLACDRLESISRGMPNLDPDLEQVIWEIAFDIHKQSCEKLSHPGYREHTMSVPWGKEPNGPVCSCFDRALKYYEEHGKTYLPSKEEKPVVIELPLEDLNDSYERQV